MGFGFPLCILGPYIGCLGTLLTDTQYSSLKCGVLCCFVWLVLVVDVICFGLELYAWLCSMFVRLLLTFKWFVWVYALCLRRCRVG